MIGGILALIQIKLQDKIEDFIVRIFEWKKERKESKKTQSQLYKEDMKILIKALGKRKI